MATRRAPKEVTNLSLPETTQVRDYVMQNHLEVELERPILKEKQPVTG